MDRHHDCSTTRLFILCVIFLTYSKFNFILVALNYATVTVLQIENSIIFRHYIINYQPSSTTFRTQHFRVVPNFIYIPYYKIILYSHVRPPT